VTWKVAEHVRPRRVVLQSELSPVQIIYSFDSRGNAGINAKGQVVDFSGNVILGLYCGGESARGFSLHGLARCTVQGRIAGWKAAAESSVKISKS
jgi:succinate dehydrogenase/fumarate reductase flavoprotein subunit